MLLVYSGGLDSSSALHIFKEDIKLAVSFNYGSKHNAREIQMAKLNCERLGIEHKVVNLVDAFKDIKGALLNPDETIPHGHYAESNMASTVVPFRNGIMLSIAAGIAESNGLGKIMLASHSGDHAVYPDCTPDFNKSMYKAIEAGTSLGIEVVMPFESVDKKWIAKEGLKSGMVPSQTYSCYEGNEVHCGRCGTCVERLWSLEGLGDNTEYKDKNYYKGVIDGSN